ncbi:MAG TPA: NlpC/P60 family protein [Kineosporiaceae bacterium]|nr:NlpC/P60 family protein [Kineosporiaceae bacterium]
MTDTLSTLNATVTDQASAVGRGGLVLAVSSGLVAGVGLPADTGHTTVETGPRTGSVPLTSPVRHDLAASPVTAARTAQVAFERAAFHPVHQRPPHTAGHRRPAHAATARHRTPAHRAPAVQAPVQRTPVPTAPRPTTARTSTPNVAASTSTSSRGASVIALASRYLGVPYLYGGASPRGFDCSGLTQYVYGLLGVRLPRSAAAQYAATTHVARSQARPGDLVFFFTGGTVTHVGVYLGGTMMIAAPHTGDVVKKQTIYSANVAFGRV